MIRLPKLFFWLFFTLAVNNAFAQKDSVRVIAMLDKAYELEAVNPKRALKLYHDAHVLSIRNNYEIGSFKALQYSGLVHNDNGNYDSALYYFQKSKPYSKTAKYPRGEGMTFINMGNTYQFKGDYNTAVKLYLSGLKIFEKIKDSAALSQSYQNLSALYTTLKNPELEILYLKKALQFLNPDNKDQAAMLYGDLGLTLLNQGKTKQAFLYFTKTDNVAKTSENPRVQFIAKRNLGDYYAHIKQYEKAISHYEAANILGKGHKVEQNDLLYLLSGLYLEMKNYPKALVYSQESVKLSKQIQTREILYKSYRRLAEIYTITNRKELAYDYLIESVNLKDSVMNENYLKQISLVQTQYETEKKDKAIAEQQIKLNKNEVELLQKQRQTILSLIVILILVVLSIGIWLFFRQRQRIKNKEILALKQQQEIAQLEALIDGEEKERRRIAQELHDGINGDLSAIKFRLSALEDAVADEENRENLMKTIEMIDNSCAQVRSISHNLMPASIVDFGLVETIRQYCAKIDNTHPLELEFQYFGNPAVLPQSAETVIYRIIQELINNIIKHAEATSALVQLNFHENELSITVEDNGKGFDVHSVPNGIGLKNINSRIHFLNAQLDLNSNDSGTSFHITIDLNSL